jgi:hypothetical protein
LALESIFTEETQGLLLAAPERKAKHKEHSKKKKQGSTILRLCTLPASIGGNS